MSGKASAIDGLRAAYRRLLAFANRLVEWSGRIIATALLLSVLTLGYCMFDGRVDGRAFEKRCRDNAGVTVHDVELWNAYIRQAEAIHQERVARYGPTNRIVVQPVEGYDLAFGEQRHWTQQGEMNKTIRSDIWLLHQGRPIASFYELVRVFPGLGTPNSEQCSSLVPELYYQHIGRAGR